MFKWILNKLRGDKLIWLSIFLVAMIGLVVVYSASSALAFRFKGGNTEYYLIKHLALLGLGFLVMVLIHFFDYRIFAKLSTIMLIITIPVLLYALFQGGTLNANSQGRWISVFGQSFQPSDLAKLSLTVYLARILTQKQEVIRDFKKSFLPVLGWVSLICLLIAPTDLSTAAVIFVTSLMLMFIAGVDLKYLGGLVLVGAVALFILFKVADRAEIWEERWETYTAEITGKQEPVGQKRQALIAISSGGVIGKGVGKSTARNYLPQASSDFAYAIVVEEYGFLGGLLVLGLYLFLLIRSVGIVTMSKTFGALLAAGLSFMLVIQALINMGVAVGILPVTGLTLPMLSMGGTSMIFTGMALGIILSVSRSVKGDKKKGLPTDSDTGPENKLANA